MKYLHYIGYIIVALANVGAIVILCYCDYPIINTLIIINMIVVDCVVADAWITQNADNQ